MQRTSSSLRYVNCGPGHIQGTYSSAYSAFNIHLDIFALLLYISRQFNERYTAFLVPNTEHIVPFTLCELWSRTYTKYLQFLIFMPQYPAVRICAAIVDITWLQCALYCKLGAKYSAQPPVYAMWTVVPGIYNALTAPHIQNSIFVWTFLRCYCTYHDNSMRAKLHSWCQIQSTSSSLRCVKCGAGHIQTIYSSAYLGFNIQL
jgi:hypothetical protein